MPRAHTKRRGPVRIDALDGLRTFAIISVMLYHLSVPWLPSGHMGVVVFLVLSGYLASSTVLRTMRREGGVSLWRLWLKRVTRIWPAMAVMIAVTVGLCVLFNHVLLTKLRPDLLPSLLLANNIGAIIRGASYFDNLGGTSPLTHLWYLGVDIQFFVVWTAIATFLCPKGRPTRAARVSALGLAVVSALLMAILYDPNGDPTRVYYGPDTRAFAPLLGAWLGLAWPLGARPVRLDAAKHTVRSIPLGIASPVALLGIVVIMVVSPGMSPFLFRGGMLLVALLTVIVLAGALERRSLFSAILGLKPFVWLGARSYGLYLWHFPIFQLLKVTSHETSPLVVLLAIALSFAAAEISLRLVERALGARRFPLVLGDPTESAGAARLLGFVPAIVAALFVVTGAVGLLVVPEEVAVPTDAIKSTGSGAAEAMDLSNRKEQAQQEGDSSKDDANEEKKEEEQKSASTELESVPDGPLILEPSDKDKKDGLYSPVIVADSIAGGIDWYLEDHMPGALLDSYVGRQPFQALSVLQDYIKQNVVGNIVVLNSFSNMPATDDQMEDLIKACGDRHVYLVNVRIPAVEQEQINQTLSKFANKYRNVKLINWYAYSQGHDDWFYDDGTHLTPEGQPEYANMIAHAIAEDFAADGGKVRAEETEKEKDSTSTSSSKSDSESSGTSSKSDSTSKDEGDTSSESSDSSASSSKTSSTTEKSSSSKSSSTSSSSS